MPGRIKTAAAGRGAMGVLGALGALPADVDVSVGSVLPEARALKGRLESSTLGASLRPPWAARTPLIAPAVLYIAGGMRSELSRARRGGKEVERGQLGWCSGGCRGSVGEARVGEALPGRISRFNGEREPLPPPPGPSRRAVQPRPRGAAGGSQEGLLKASECHLKRAALVGLEGLTERRWGG